MQVLKDKIDQLNRQAWDVRVSDSTLAFALSKEAVTLAREVAYTKGLAEGLRTFGFSHLRLSRHHEALGYLEEALPLFQSLNDERGQSDVYGYFGAIQRMLGDYAASLNYLFKALTILLRVKDAERESLCQYHIGVTYKYLGNYDQALNHLFQSLSTARAAALNMPESYALNQIGLLYFESSDYDHALEYYEQSLDVRRKLGDKWGEAGSLDNIGFIHFKKGNYDTAKDFCSEALSISKSIGDKKGQSNSLFRLANIYKELREYERASEHCGGSLQLRREIGDKKGESEILLFLAGLSVSETHVNKTVELLTAAMKLARELNAVDLLSRIHLGFYQFYKQHGQHEKALSYLEGHINFEKELHTESVKQKMINLETSQLAEASRRDAENYRIRNIELDRLYAQSERQKEEIEVQKKNAEQALAELKAAQTQLIQSEKMASLGELTAGIAHEIQNPLNFVNNFSEVNNELIEELKSQKSKVKSEGSDDENEILNDIFQNNEKISFHGKRADAIVKGMLQHSRVSTGQKELTDVNVLTDEYLRLAYHGLRAKDKTFNAEIRTDFDPSVGRVNIVPQDIGRVILNLINNAFYAVNGRQKAEGGGYPPTVIVTTRKTVDKILISVADNGNGIPKNIIEKIFQPFFTTKPTGQGTGLGLSLAYDIVKAHGGEMKVDTKEGEGSEFVIQLPATSNM